MVLDSNYDHIQLVSSIAKAEVTGDSMGSQTVTFVPLSRVEGGKLTCGGKTAASTSLMLQCLLPILLYAKNMS